MKVLCKAYYPYGENDIPIHFQMFLTGMSYEAHLISHPNGEIWYTVQYDEHFKGEIFSPSDFADYFFTVAEMRKKKILKINAL